MRYFSGNGVDSTKILTRRELAEVLSDLKRKSVRSRNTWMNLILVRLSCCCGLRVSEIAGLRISDIRVEPSRPNIRIRRGASKGGKPRTVPLWWDSGTLAELKLEGRAPRTDHGSERTVRWLVATNPPRYDLVSTHHAPSLPYCLQGTRARAARGADYPPREAHVHQPCAGGTSDAGGGARCRGTCEHQHH